MMKLTTTIFIFMLLTLSLFNGYAFDHPVERMIIPVQGYEQTELDYKIELNHDLDYDRIFLDCQSFLNGIDFYKLDEENDQLVQVDFFHLWPDECMQGLEMAVTQDLQCIILSRDHDKNSFKFIKDENECY